MGWFKKNTSTNIDQDEADRVRRKLANLNASEERNKACIGGQSAQDRAGFARHRDQLNDQLDWALQRGRYKNS